ncbi:MAG TPA: hypothetical protein VGR73_23290 [Bryobacteraceae bacterium]|nr:hypothetical protein [Bryobacteraceae bacterium]
MSYNLAYPHVRKLDSSFCLNLGASAYKRSPIGAMVAVCAVLGMVPAAAQEVSPDVHHDVSGPLQAMSRPPLAGPKHETPLFRLHGPVSGQSDPVVQTSAGPLVGTTVGLNFAGVGDGDYGFTPNAAPPDTNGAVGATQYVQWVNESFAIFDKTTGAKLLGPVAGNSLWSGFGGGCQTNNDGDPIVQYDKAANRWIFTQFSVKTKPYLQCVAVSTTSDATGAYNRYAFSQPNFPDYPKLGVWPDAYYVSFNMFSGNSFLGGRACAFDSAAMRAGNPATQVCFQLGNAFGGLLPSDLDGSTAPPAGSPDFFVAFDNNSTSLDLWKFHVDFVTPANSTFLGPTNIPVAAFSAACNGGGTCIPQLNTTQQLDSLADRLMYRLAYRNFGDHEALVANHSVTAGGSVGVRWYELRSPNGTPTVFQQGTFAPDSNYRWMGSIAMDQAGDIALGYSVSSSSMNPSIYYTGRVPGDALGTLEAENVITTGTGSQTGGLSRWGDYSAMAIDPSDDCTFFYTNEYLKTDGSFNWSTRIASFKFSGCGGPPPADFSLSANPTSLTLTQGNGGNSTITVTSLNGFNNSVGLAVSGCPTGATCSLPTPVTPPANGTATPSLSVTTTTSTSTGTFTLTISGTSGALHHTTTVSLTVNPAPVPNFSISANPTSLTLTQGNGGNSTITVTSMNGFSSLVGLSVSGCPSGATCSVNPTSVNPTATSTLTVATTTGTSTGTFLVTVTGTSGALTHSTTVTVTVNPVPIPDFSITASPGSVRVRHGGTAAYTVTITSSGGFGGVVTFSASGLPGSTTATFNPTSVTGSGASTLSLKTASNTPTGSFTVTIKGVSGSLTHTTTVTLTVAKH